MFSITSLIDISFWKKYLYTSWTLEEWSWHPWTFLFTNLLLKLYSYAKLIHQLVHRYFLNKRNWFVVNTQTETHMVFKIQISPYEKKREKFKERHDWTRTTSGHRIPPPTVDFFILLLISPFTFNHISGSAFYTL